MGTGDLNATVEIKSGLQREPWTWAQTYAPCSIT